MGIVVFALVFVALPMELYVRQERKIDQLEQEAFQRHGELQELKQTMHMIQMRNEGIEYIDELPEGDLPWSN